MWGKFLIKNQLTHPDPKRIADGKCPPSSQLGLKQFLPFFSECAANSDCTGAERKCEGGACICKSGFKEDPANSGEPNACIAGRKSLTMH